eukprot:evm.model.scf_501.6 EVM.evm.TU.scf_501.6   scf_501:70139-72122(+)
MENSERACSFRLNNDDLMQNLSSVGWEGSAFSDIKVHLRGQSFKLHRLILSRSPYFNTLFTGNWNDSKKREIQIRTDDLLVTADAFRDVIGTLYSRPLTIDNGNVREMFATSSYFGMMEISKRCVAFIKSQLCPNNIVEYINFARSCEYDLCKDITDGCEAYLCQHAFRDRAMHAKFWEVQLFMVVNVLKSDSLWVPSEYHRYCFAKEVLVKKMMEDDEDDSDNQSVADSAAEFSDPGAGGDSSGASSVLYPYDKQDSGLYPVVQFPRPICDPPQEPSVCGEAEMFGKPYHRRSASVASSMAQVNSGGSGKVVEAAILDVLKTGIAYAHIGHDVILEVLRDVKGMQNRNISDAFRKGMSQAHLFQLLTEKAGSGLHALAGLTIGDDLSPPFRFSVQFKDVAQISERCPTFSDRHFYGGSWWWLSCCRVTYKDRNGPGGPESYHGIYLHRDNSSRSSPRSPFRDAREKAAVQYQFRCCDISYTGTSEVSKAVGHPDVIPGSRLDEYTVGGSLFFTAILQLVF